MPRQSMAPYGEAAQPPAQPLKHMESSTAKEKEAITTNLGPYLVS